MAKKDAIKTPRAFKSNIRIQLGLATFLGKMVPVAKGSSKDSFKSICPHTQHGDDVAEVSQVYLCKVNAEHHGEGPTGYTMGELAKGKDTGAGIVRVAKEEIAETTEAATAEFEEGVLELRIHPADQVLAGTYLGGNAYTFYPEGATKPYHTLRAVIESHPELAFIGMLNAKGTKLYQLRVRGELVILQQLLFPEDLNDTATVPAAEVDAKQVEMANSLVEALVDDFDAEAVRNRTKEALAALVESKATGAEVVALPTGPAKADEDSLMAALEASVSAAKVKKAS